MFKRIALTGAVAAAAALALVPASIAGGGNSSNAIAGARCVKAGVGFLVQNNLLRAAALQQIDYSTLDSGPGGAGLINTDLPNPSYLSLGTVIRLHFTNPELFDWCAS
jgi:hypothetical protein